MGLAGGGLGGDASPSSADAPYQPVLVEAGKLIISFIPGANTVLGIYELVEVIRDPNSTTVDVVIATAGVIPYGGIVKKGVIVAKKAGVLGAIVKAGEKGAARRGVVRDYATRNTKNWSAAMKSEGDARALARQKLGANPVEVEPGKWRSADGKWQYRAKPGDVSNRHIHLEELNPQTGEVLQNVHLRWPEGTGR